MKKVLCFLILLTFIQTADASGAGRVLVIVGGLVLEMAKGFATELGAEGARRLVEKYPPPNPEQGTETYAGSKGGYVSYEFVGLRGGSPIYRTTASDDFIQNLKQFDRRMDEFEDQLIDDGLIDPDHYRELRRNREKYKQY